MIESPYTTITLVPVLNRGVSKRDILKSLVFHVLNFKSWIKLIYDRVNFDINEFNPTFEVQNMGNEAFQNASFGIMPRFQTIVGLQLPLG